MRSLILVGQAMLVPFILLLLTSPWTLVLGLFPCSESPVMRLFDGPPEHSPAVDLSPEFTLKDFLRQRKLKTKHLSVEVRCDCDASAFGFDALPITTSMTFFSNSTLPGSSVPRHPFIDFTHVNGSWMIPNPPWGKILDITIENIHLKNLQHTIDLRNVALTVQDCSFSNSSVTPLRLTFDIAVFIRSGGDSSVSPPAARIKNSQFSGNGWSSGDAGGIAFSEKWPGGSIEIVDTSFMTGKGDLSGAVSLKMMHGVARVRDCVFKENLSKVSGGALYIQSGDGLELYLQIGDDAKVSVESSKFIKNGAYMRGGALYIVGTGKVNIVGNDFVQNLAGESGGAIFVDGPSSPSLISEQGGDLKTTKFDRNMAGHKGGGMFFAKTVLYGPRVVSSVFDGNEARGRPIGFASFAQSTLEERRKNDEDVKIPEGDGRGGALYFEGDDNFMLTGRATVVVTANTGFHRNHAGGNGGAICSEGRTLDVFGRKIFSEMGAAAFYANRAGDHGGAIFVKGGRGVRLWWLDYVINASTKGRGGAVAIQDSQGCNIRNSLFHVNHGFQIASALSVIKTVLEVSNTIFDENVSHEGGTVYIESSKRASFIQSSFTGNIGYPTGGLWVEYSRRNQTTNSTSLEALPQVVFDKCVLVGNQVSSLARQQFKWHGAAIHLNEMEDHLDLTNQDPPLLQLTMNDVFTMENVDNSTDNLGNADIRIDGPATIASTNWYAGGTFTSQGHQVGSNATAIVAKCELGPKTMSAAEVICKDCFWYTRVCNPTGSSQLCDTDNSSCRPPARLAVPWVFFGDPPPECASLKGPKIFDWWKYMEEYSFYCVLLAKTGDVKESSSNAIWLIPSNQGLAQWASSLDEIRELSQTQARAIVAAHSVKSLKPHTKHSLGGIWVLTTARSSPIYTVPPAFHATRLSKLGKPLFGPLKSIELSPGPPTALHRHLGRDVMKATITRDFLKDSEEPFDDNRILLIDATLFLPPRHQRRRST